MDDSLRIFSPDHVFRSPFAFRNRQEHLDVDTEKQTSLAQTSDLSLGRHLFEDDVFFMSHSPMQSSEQQHSEHCISHEAASAPVSLRSLPQFKKLSLRIHLLYYFERCTGVDQVNEALSLVDNLPPNLEALCINGLKWPEDPGKEFDRQCLRHPTIEAAGWEGSQVVAAVPY
ncbi:hypothetical protein BDV09DRAFT_197527 [Aspergillus tetrazonus]